MIRSSGLLRLAHALLDDIGRLGQLHLMALRHDVSRLLRGLLLLAAVGSAAAMLPMLLGGK